MEGVMGGCEIVFISLYSRLGQSSPLFGSGLPAFRSVFLRKWLLDLTISRYGVRAGVGIGVTSFW
jgi:hypothetical protein